MHFGLVKGGSFILLLRETEGFCFELFSKLKNINDLHYQLQFFV